MRVTGYPTWVSGWTLQNSGVTREKRVSWKVCRLDRQMDKPDCLTPSRMRAWGNQYCDLWGELRATGNMSQRYLQPLLIFLILHTLLLSEIIIVVNLVYTCRCYEIINFIIRSQYESHWNCQKSAFNTTIGRLPEVLFRLWILSLVLISTQSA